jgi:acyl carrier protein
MTSETRQAIRDYLHRELMQDRPDFLLTDETNLLTEHIVDSLGIFLLVTFLEERFGIVVDADEVLVEHFETVAAVARLVEAKRPASDQEFEEAKEDAV